MPLYEYQCASCGRKIEVVQRFADEPLTTCESCGGPLKKLLSAPAFQFKGSGWYVTDYARAQAKSDSGQKSAEAAGTAGEGKDAKSGDASPATDKTSEPKTGEAKASAAPSSSAKANPASTA